MYPSQMAGRVVILPEQLLPPRPLHLFACPPNIYTGYVANRHAARTEGAAGGKQAEKYDQLLQVSNVFRLMIPFSTYHPLK